MDLLDLLLGEDILPQADPCIVENIDQSGKTDKSPSVWLKNASSGTIAALSHEKEKNNIEFWDTKITKVHPSMLVWAKNNYYTQKNSNRLNYFPARICEEHEVCMVF